MPVPLGILAAGAGGGYWALGSDTSVGTNLNAVADSEGNVYWAVQVASLSSRVYKFNSAGTKLWEKGYNTGCTSIILDSSNNLYIQDGSNSRVVKVNSATGGSIWGVTVTGMSVNQIVADSSSNIFIRDSGNERIAKLDAAGNAISWAKQVSQGASTVTFRAMAIDADGNPWISSEQSGDLRLIEFANSDGSQLTTIGKDSDVDWARMAIASNGDIYIGQREGAGQSTLPIRRFNSSGTELSSISIAVPTVPSGQSHTLQGFALDSSDNLYILFTNDSTDVAYLWKLDSALSPVFTQGIKNNTLVNPSLDELSVRGSDLYVSGGRMQIWKLPIDGRLTGTYSVMDSGAAALTSYTYGTYSLSTSSLSALAADTEAGTVTNPTVTVATFTPTVTDESTTFVLTTLGN